MGEDRISRTQVEHLARLARIDISEDEKEHFTKQLNQVLEFFRKIDEVESESIESELLVELSNVLREDKVKSSLTQEEVLSNASASENGYIKAPRTL